MNDLAVDLFPGMGVRYRVTAENVEAVCALLKSDGSSGGKNRPAKSETPRVPSFASPMSGPDPSLFFLAGDWYRWTRWDGWRPWSLVEVRAELARFNLVAGKGFQKSEDILTGEFAAPPTVKSEQMILRRNGKVLEAEPTENWIATRSHAVNVVTGETRPVEPSLFIQGMVGCDYDPEATCPRWEKFVGEVVGPEESEILRKMFGLSLTYDRRFNVFFVVYGEGGTGKSTCLNVLAALNAGACCSVSLGMFGERFQTYPLAVNRMNLVQDMDSIFEGSGSVTTREALLKSACCGETWTVEKKGVDGVPKKLVALNVFGANNLPRFADRSNAISDRMRIIPFFNRFRGEAGQDMDLGRKLVEELPGILNWAILGYRDLLEGGVSVFPESTAGAEIKLTSIKSARPEELFFDECVRENSAGREPTMNLYSRYENWCRLNGYKHPLAMNQFSERVYRRFPNANKKRMRSDGGTPVSCVVGVELLKVPMGLVDGAE